MRTLMIVTAALIATSATAFAQNTSTTAPAAGAPGIAARSAPSAPQTTVVTVPANFQATVQAEVQRKASMCAAKGPGYVWRVNTKFGQPRPNGGVYTTIGTCRSRQVSVSEMQAAGIDPAIIQRVLAADRPAR